MNQRYNFITIISVILLLTLSFSLSLAAAKHVEGQQSLQERAINAAQQLRDYHQRTGLNTKNGLIRTLSALPQGATIHIDKTFKTTSAIFFHDDMESGIGTWTTQAYSGSDLWHQTTLKANSGNSSWWAGIEPQANYDNGQRIENALKSEPIDLTTATGPVQLLFTENYVTEAGWDFCMVDVSTDAGITWIPLRGGYGDAPSGDSQGWILTTLDLSSYIGHTIIIRFHFDTYDGKFNDFPGWFVDNVVLFDQSGMITGKTFFDVNDNGIKDLTDRGVKDWLVTATGTGTTQGITIATKTDYRGKFWLPLPLGSYTITDEIKDGWVQTFPSPFPSQLTITMTTPDTLVDSTWFGNFTNASFINGKVFNDVDKSGAYNSETDSMLICWRVILSDTLGNLVDYDYTDSLGVYQLFVLAPGRYIISEAPGKLHHGWVESYPTSETYTIDIPNLSTTLNDMDFGNYFSPLTNAVIGQAFNDRNRNQLFDTDELGTTGFTIHLIVRDALNDVIYNRKRVTDSSGYYQFQGVPSGNCEISQLIGPNNVGWWPSSPPAPYTLPLNDGETLDSMDFGNYEIAHNIVSGMVFNDLDTSGTKETGEEGLGGWTIHVTGTTIYSTSISTSTISGSDGQYSFGDLWPGQYTVNEVFRAGWRQTYPTNLKSHIFAVTVEENKADLDFGNTLDSDFSLSFRTFVPESLALAVDKKNKHCLIPMKPDKAEFTLGFINNERADSVVKKLVIQLNLAPTDTLQITPWGNQVITGKLVEIIFPTAIDSADTVAVHGFVPKPKLVTASKWWWYFESGAHSKVKKGGANYSTNAFLYPLPNAINGLAAGAGTNIKVGLGGPHSIVHKTYKDVLKSLLDNHGMHVGEPRCLSTYATSGASMKAQKSNLPPTKGQNKLFAEAVALQVNIKASDLNITPGGFGNLVFNDGGTNPFNGKSIREVAAVLDQYMSSYKDSVGKNHCAMPAGYEALDSIGIFNIIRMINAAFSGPLDTAHWVVGGLEFTSVRALSDVSFLKLDSSFAQLGASIGRYPETSSPDRYTLSQNYPNPFNPSTIIEFYLPEQSFVTLKIYNTLGQEVATLIDHQEMEFGTQEFELSSTATNLATGVYYYRLIAETITDEDVPAQKFISTKKMILLK